MNILHIDDNNEITSVFSTVLSSKGFDYTSVPDGKKGAALILENKFDLILLDLAMPGFSGFDVLQEVREKGYKKENIIILTSSTQFEKETEKLLKLNIKQIIQKPIKIKKLLELIDSYEECEIISNLRN